jgi:hypothetical protein
MRQRIFVDLLQEAGAQRVRYTEGSSEDLAGEWVPIGHWGRSEKEKLTGDEQR